MARSHLNADINFKVRNVTAYRRKNSTVNDVKTLLQSSAMFMSIFCFTYQIYTDTTWYEEKKLWKYSDVRFCTVSSKTIFTDSYTRTQMGTYYCTSSNVWLGAKSKRHSWVKTDQLDVTCFIISLYNAQHVSDVNTSILGSLRLMCWVISWVTLIWFDVCWNYVVVWQSGVVSVCRLKH